MILSLYKFLSMAAGPLVGRHLQKRLANGKEDPQRFKERLGQAAISRPKGALVWLHGASVGESLSLLPVIEAIRQNHTDLNILITTGTVTSANLMAQRLPEGVLHQFVPIDHPNYVKEFLEHWHPDFAIWSESDLWPNLLLEANKRQISMVLVNARMSEKSAKNWRFASKAIKTLLGSFELCLAQSESDVKRLQSLGATKVQCLGNLKYASQPLPYDPHKLEELVKTVKGRPLWMAASTHAGEEETCAQIHKMLKNRIPELLTIIVPRHPDRADDIINQLAPLELSVSRRSKGDALEQATDIYLADTMGEMGLLYRLAPIVLMGKSLHGIGGQNPLEPARLDCAILCGPHMTNFREIMARFEAVNAVQVVNDASALLEELETLLKNEEARSTLADKAKVVADAEAGVITRVMGALQPYLERLESQS